MTVKRCYSASRASKATGLLLGPGKHGLIYAQTLVTDAAVEDLDVNGNPDNGRLATDRPHAVKIFGGYVFDWFKNDNNSTDFTASFLGTSGTPVSTQVSLFNANTFVFGRNDLGRTENFTQTDFAITHHYRFGRDSRYNVAFEANFINLFDERNVTDV